MKNSLNKKIILFWKGWGCPIFIALLIATSFESAIADWYVVPTGSMKPTIVEGDRVFVNKLAYDLKVPYTTWHIAAWGAPERGDIVVFNSHDSDTRLIKRIVGIPGDSLEMRDNRLIINGRRITYEPVESLNKENPLSMETSYHETLVENLNDKPHPVWFSPGRNSVIQSFGPLTIPEGKYFVMGDNRDNSRDSRYFGFVDRETILGQAKSIVISLDINNHYRPRWNRFFTALP